jgi:hypothetical protein
MDIPNPHRFWHPGPAEYILVKAGLFRVVDLTVSPTERLTRLLDPLPDELLPPLVQMAEICALELGGAIDTYPLRARVVSDLKELGLPDWAIGDLFVLVTEGAASTAEERRREPKFAPL